MNLIKYQTKPTSKNNRLSLFDELWQSSFEDFLRPTATHSIPAVNIAKEDDHYVLELAAPGFAKEDFNVSVENNQLVIKGHKNSEETTHDDKNYHRKEFSHQSFERSFTISEEIDENNISGSYLNGILTLHLGIKEEKLPVSKSIEID